MNASVVIRILSALVLAPPLLFLLLVGSPFLLFLLSIPVSALLVYEWHRLREPFALHRFLPLLFGVLVVLLARVPESIVPLSTVVRADYLMQPWPKVTWMPESILYSFLLMFFFVVILKIPRVTVRLDHNYPWAKPTSFDLHACIISAIAMDAD